ncbi:uncharacterized protein LOC112611469 [Theropithecus gelada]|uniref:uncharacterized protein LOC112611469 n=1 Tax=Theropithecus gelada TaxID=9565 RepID=UPI000DC15E19|nr:uncharacterized protein LOC112611469 [Theropithecus gelada]
MRHQNELQLAGLPSGICRCCSPAWSALITRCLSSPHTPGASTKCFVDPMLCAQGDKAPCIDLQQLVNDCRRHPQPTCGYFSVTATPLTESWGAYSFPLNLGGACDCSNK